MSQDESEEETLPQAVQSLMGVAGNFSFFIPVPNGRPLLDGFMNRCLCVYECMCVLCDLVSILEAPPGCSVGSGMGMGEQLGKQEGTVGNWPEMIVETPGPPRAFRR